MYPFIFSYFASIVNSFVILPEPWMSSGKKKQRNRKIKNITSHLLRTWHIWIKTASALILTVNSHTKTIHAFHKVAQYREHRPYTWSIGRSTVVHKLYLCMSMQNRSTTRFTDRTISSACRSIGRSIGKGSKFIPGNVLNLFLNFH